MQCSAEDTRGRRGNKAKSFTVFWQVFDAVAARSRKHGLTQPVRAADLLPVTMMEFSFDHFVTADNQQHQFALAAGYTLVFLPP